MFAAALEGEGYSVWWDVGLRTGEAYDEVTENALRAAKAVIVLWSKKSVVSRWVRAEATLASRNNTLFPCMIEACDRPIMFELTQTADLTHWRGGADDPTWRIFLVDLKNFIEGGARPSAGEQADRVIARPAPNAQSFRFDRRAAIIAGGAAVALGGAGLAAFRIMSPSLAKNGVAVLPFRNTSGDPEQDYLSIGLSTEVRSALARNAALRVVAQASCEAVRARALSAAEMAKTLAVSFLLDGNVRVEGDRVRVTTELIDGKTGFTRWSELFERPKDDIARVQSAIAASVEKELSIGDESAADDAEYGMTNDAIAFEDYLKGNRLYALAANTEMDLEALARFDSALQRDPDFGAAHAARARSLTSLGNTTNNIVKARLYYQSAADAAERAIAAGPSSADAHSTLGYVLFQAQLRVADAREPYDRSYELGRGDGPVLARFAGYAAATRRDGEARAAVERAVDLDPLNATIHRAVGFVHYAAGRYQASIDAVDSALGLNSKLSDAHARIAMALTALGRPEAALAAAEKEPSGMMRYPALAIAHRALGAAAEADKAMADLVSSYGDAGLYQQAQVLSQWKRADEAMTVLNRALDVGDSGLTYAYIDPTLDPLRNREDFNRLLQSLGFV